MDVKKILEIASNPKNIRNVGLSAQVDHGKTTLSDVILSHAGIIASKMAGKVLYLDYLEEEQKRGITIKTAAITLLMELGKEKYILNLIDTPGHVDFSGKVARAMRLMDGVIILVDAVEGIMAQTESYLRVALEEYVKPILFINKMDRLIDELSLGPSQIQKRLEEIIIGFNQLIDLFGDDWQKKNWKVNPLNETVLFGSALQGWGISVKDALRRGIKFNHIYKLYKESVEKIKREFPLGELIARVIYEKIPSPIDAQKYRIQKLWEGEKPQDLLKCEKKSKKTIFYVSKTIIEAGKIFVIGRVFSGTLRRGEYYCLNTKKKLRLNAVHLVFGSSSKYVEWVPAGMVFGGFIKARPGYTFSNEIIEGSFKPPYYVAVPVVVFIAIEPKRFSDFDKLLSELEKLMVADPNISVTVNKDTGQILLGGLGELHLEIILKELTKRIEVYSTEPMISYREILVKGSEESSDSISLKLIPIIEEGYSLRDILSERIRGALDGNLIEIKNFSIEDKEAILSTIRDIVKNGPLIGEPIIGAHIIVKKRRKEEKVDINDLINLLGLAFSKARTEIAEPYYKFSISTYTDYLGTVIGEINKREGKIRKMEGTSGNLIKIEGLIPVRTSLQLPSIIRSITRGRASIQLEFYDYIIAKDKARETIIRELQIRKGLL